MPDLCVYQILSVWLILSSCVPWKIALCIVLRIGENPEKIYRIFVVFHFFPHKIKTARSSAHCAGWHAYLIIQITPFTDSDLIIYFGFSPICNVFLCPTMVLFFRAHSCFWFSGRGKTKDNNFYVRVHEGQDIPLVQILGSYKVHGGSKIALVLNPLLIESTAEVKALRAEDRKCGIPEDTNKDNEMFQVSTF